MESKQKRCSLASDFGRGARSLFILANAGLVRENLEETAKSLEVYSKLSTFLSRFECTFTNTESIKHTTQK